MEIFKTNISDASEAKRVIDALQKVFPGDRIAIDLHDPEHILSIQSPKVDTEKVVTIVKQLDYQCTWLG